MDRQSVQLAKANGLKLRNKVKDFSASFKKRYDKFPWKLISKVPNSTGNEIVIVRGSKFTVKSLKAEILKLNKSLKVKTKPNGFNSIINAYNKEVARVIKMNGSKAEINKVYNSFNDTLTTQFKQTKDDLMFCIEGMRQLTKYLRERDKVVKESYDEYLETKRSELDDSEFGIPSKRKFPLDTEEHVRSAAKFFNYADESDMEELAKRIKARADDYGIKLNPGKKNKLSNYIESEELTMHSFDKYDDELKTFILEAYEAILDSDDDEEETVTEGQNHDMRRLFKSHKKVVKKAMKRYKKAVKKSDFAEAKNALAEARKAIDEAEKDIANFTADDIGSMILSWYTAWTIDLGHNLVVGLTSIIPVVNIINMIKETINSVSAARATGLKSGSADVSGPEAFNAVKPKIMKALERYRKAIDAASKNIDAVGKHAAKAKIAKESAELDDAILALYDECAKGAITIDEREEQINLLRESFKEDAALEETLIEEELATESSKHEKFTKVKKVLYEKCSKGEITEEQREDLISAAFDRIFETAIVEEPEQDYSDREPEEVNESGETPAPATANNTDVQKEIDQEAEKAAKEAEKAATEPPKEPQPADK